MNVYLSGATIDAILKLHAGAAGVTENGVSKMVMLIGEIVVRQSVCLETILGQIYTGWWWLAHYIILRISIQKGNVIIPIDDSSIIFQRGRSTTKQYRNSLW